MEIAHRKLKGQKDKYSTELRKFALTLQFYSPRGYAFVRKVFGNLLPHSNTLRRWCCNIDGVPEFSTEVLQTIQKLHSSDKPIICNLVLDEMSIRRSLTVRDGKMYGFVDFGFMNEGDDEEYPVIGSPITATKALVFMLVSLNDKWKCPCGYFFVDTLTSDNQATLIKKLLALLHEYYINVHSITFDGLRTNFSTAKDLGANMDVQSEDFKPYFMHPITNEPVYFIPDPCHMLKNIRNAFAKLGKLVDSEGREIFWSDIKKVVEIQEAEGLHIATKMRKRHINFQQSVMNVRLATQTLSNSTMNALLYLNKVKKYKNDFKSAEATATFCKNINDTFDLLNCRSRFSKRFETHKRPISPETVGTLKQYATELIAYIRGLKGERTVRKKKEKDPSIEPQQQHTPAPGRKKAHSRSQESDSGPIPILKHTLQCGFAGMIIALQNVFLLYEYLRKKYGLEYLLTYKLLQDHIENFFSAIRIKGGFNNNPSAFQFRCAYRRLLIHHDVRSSEYANCQPDYVPILTVSFKRKEETRIFDEDILDNYDLFNFEELIEIPSDVVCDVVEYIGGFIVQKLLNKKSVKICGHCLELLQTNTVKSMLITMKDRGGLVPPPKDVFDICLNIERIIRSNPDKIF